VAESTGAYSLLCSGARGKGFAGAASGDAGDWSHQLTLPRCNSAAVIQCVRVAANKEVGITPRGRHRHDALTYSAKKDWGLDLSIEYLKDMPWKSAFPPFPPFLPFSL
jgi:hypothetical protein